MGIVLAARHIEVGLRVAIKFTRGEIARDASAAVTIDGRDNQRRWSRRGTDVD